MTDKEIELEKLKLNVDVWKKIVDVQQHFNDLEMKVRNFGLLIVSAFISAIGVSINSHYEVGIGDYSFPVAAFLSAGALIVWLLVFFVDVYWYHPLLKGAVIKGIKMENQLKSDLPNINLTETIGDESAIDIFCFSKVRSTAKAKVFYLGIAAVLLSISLALGIWGHESSKATKEKEAEPQLSEVLKQPNSSKMENVQQKVSPRTGTTDKVGVVSNPEESKVSPDLNRSSHQNSIPKPSALSSD